MACSILKHKKAKDNTKQFLADVKAIPSFEANYFLDEKVFLDATKQLEQKSIEAYGISGRPWLIDDNGYNIVPNNKVLRQIDQARKRMNLYEGRLPYGSKSVESTPKAVPAKTEKGPVITPSPKKLQEKNITKNTNVYYQLNPNEVNYQLRIVSALQSDKVRQPKLNNLPGFFNDIQKQGIPSDQIDILREVISQKQGEFTKEDLIVDLLSEYSYAVEINTAKGRSDLQLDEEGEWQSSGEIQGNTQYYSNLTVPGGTNYAENEIDQQTYTKLLEFAEKAGIKVESVGDLLRSRGANGLADIKEMLIQLQNGKEKFALAEEVAHFFVEGLDENSSLYKEMMDLIPYTRIYQQVVRDYRKAYGNNVDKLKKEAMAKLISLYTSDRQQAEYWAGGPTLFDRVMQWIKKFFEYLRLDTRYNAFLESAETILEGDVSDLRWKGREGVFFQLEGIDKQFVTLGGVELTGKKLHINLNDTILNYRQNNLPKERKKRMVSNRTPEEQTDLANYYSNASLTSFAKELKDKIKEGLIKPEDITVYTSMPITPILAARLGEEFGITKIENPERIESSTNEDGDTIQLQEKKFVDYLNENKDSVFIDDKKVPAETSYYVNSRIRYTPLEQRNKARQREIFRTVVNETQQKAFELISQDTLREKAEELFYLLFRRGTGLEDKIKYIEEQLKKMTDEDLKSVFKDDNGNVVLPRTNAERAARVLNQAKGLEEGVKNFIATLTVLSDFFENISKQVKTIAKGLEEGDLKSEAQLESIIYEMMRVTKASGVFENYMESLSASLDKVKGTQDAKDLVSKVTGSIKSAQRNVKEASKIVLSKKLGGVLDGYDDYKKAQLEELKQALATGKRTITDLLGNKKEEILTPSLRANLENQVKELEKNHSTVDKVLQVFIGEREDFNSLTTWVKTLANSSDPVVASIAKMIRDGQHAVYIDAVQKTQDFGADVLEHMKKHGITQEMIERELIVVEKDRVYNPETDSYDYKDRLALLNPFKDRHVFDEKWQEVQLAREKYNESKKTSSGGDEELKKDWANKKSEFEIWKRQNWYQDYTEEFYQRYDKIKQDYGPELYEEASDLVNKINDSINAVLEELRQGFIDYKKAEFEIRQLKRDKAFLRLERNPDGTPKSEREVKIAQLLQEKVKVDNDVFEYIPNTKKFNSEFISFITALELEPEQLEALKASLEISLNSVYKLADEENLHEIKEWLDFNTHMVYSEEFYNNRKRITDKIDQLYTELRKIQGLEIDPETAGSIWNEMFPLVKPYRDEDGKIVGNEIPSWAQEQVKEYNEKLEAIRREIEAMEEQVVLTGDDLKQAKEIRTQLTSLFKSLQEIQTKATTIDYNEVFLEYIENSPEFIKWANENGHSELLHPDPQNLHQVANALAFYSFLKEHPDSEFALWFKRNHYLRKEMVENPLYDPLSNTIEPEYIPKEIYVPTYIWTRITPTDESMIKVVPGNKYSDRQVKKEYQTKKIEGLTYSSVTNRWLPKSAQFKNEAYSNLFKDKTKKPLAELLEMLTKFHFDTQVDGLSDAKIEYFLPSIAKRSLEGNVITNTFNDFLDRNNRFEEGEGNYNEKPTTIREQTMNRLRSFRQQILDGLSPESTSRVNPRTNKIEEKRMRLAVKYSQYMEPSVASKDVISTLILFRESANQSKKMKELLNTTILTKALLEDQPTQKNRLEAVKFLEDTRFFGQNKVYEVGKTLDDALSGLRKIYSLGSLSDFTGFFNNVKNGFAGRLQNFINSDFAGWSSAASMRKASGFWKNNLFYYLSESEKTPDQRSKDWYIQTYYNPMGLQDILMFTRPGAAKRFGSQYLMRWSQHVFEYAVSNNALYAHLFHKKVQRTVNGKVEQKTIYDILVVKDNRLVVEEGWFDEYGREIKNDYLIKSKSMLSSILEYTQGKVQDKIKLNTTTIGASVLFFKNWLIPMLRRRFDKKRANYVLEKDIEGYWMTFRRLIMDMYLNLRNHGETHWASFTNEERANFMTAVKEMAVMAISSAIIALLFDFDIDDEDKFKKLKEKSYFEQVALLMAIQTKLETESLSASPFFKLERKLGVPPVLTEASKFITNPVIGMAMLNDSWKLIETTLDVIDGDKSAYYDRNLPFYNIESGDSKSMHYLLKIAQIDDIQYTWDNPEGRIAVYISMLKR